MFPYLNLGFGKLPLYGILIVTGILSGGFFSKKICRFQNKDFYDFIIVLALVVVFGFIGAKLLFILVYFPVKDFFKIILDLLRDYSKSPYFASGFVFYGGLIGGIAGYFVGVKIAGCKKLDFLDVFAFAIPYVHGFGRIGCFCAGCCYGIPYEGLLAVHYKNPVSDVPLGIGIFPVQLLEAFLLLSLSVVLFFILKKQKCKTRPIYIYVLCYSVIRFFIEFLRGDTVRGYIGVFSTSQWISIALFFITLFLMILNICSKINKEDLSIAD